MLYFKILVISILITTKVYAETRVEIGLFSQQDIQGWKQKEFSGITSYSLKSHDKQSVLSADSRQSASAFYKKIRVDLEKTPILNWSWLKQLAINPGLETKKTGDDFVARLYVIKDGGFLFWKTLAINYVWSYQRSKGESWDNPFAGAHAKMVSQRDVESPGNTWLLEKRNVKQDFEALHGEKISHIDGVAIMTDSDNSGKVARALYGDIYFTDE